MTPFAQWIEALESGEFTQTTGVLRDDKGYCCLGVACEVAVRNNIIPEVVVSTSEDHDRAVYLYEDHETVLPSSVVEWLGMDYNHPRVLVDDEERGVAALNDSREWTFPALAAALRNTYPHLMTEA